MRGFWSLLLVVFGCGQDAPDAAEGDKGAPASAGSIGGGADGSAAAPSGTPPAAEPLPRASAASPSASSSSAPAPDGRLHIEGKVIQGAIVMAKVDAKVGRIEFPGHRAVVSEEGLFPIAFFRNAPKEEKMVIHFADGTSLTHVFQVEQRTYGKDKVDGLPPHMILPDAETRKKVAAAEKRIDAVRMQYGKSECYRKGFAWPIEGKVTSRYGVERILNGTDQGIHWGVDVAAPVGARVRAPACGTVVFAEQNIPLSGNTMIVDHGHGVTSTFLHLSGFAKKVGDEVAQGDVIATVGMTGRTTGPHLHWSMNYFEIRTDPELLVAPMPSP